MPTISCSGHSDHLASFLQFSSIIIASVNDSNRLFDSNFKSDKKGFISACNLLISRYPNIIRIFDKVNLGSECYGRGWVNTEYIETRRIPISKIITGEGTRDSFTAGLLYILQFHEDKHALNFAVAAYAINHSIMADYSMATINQIIGTFQAEQIYSS